MTTLPLLFALCALLLQHGSFVPPKPQRDNGSAATNAQPAVFPAVMIPQQDGLEQPLKMDKLAIDIRIVGNIAITTMDMRF